MVSASGSFGALSYNVAGLPQGLSGGNPIVNIPKISPLLGGYELVLVQEDFAHHDALAADAEHPHQSESNSQGPINYGDGLNRFSDTPFVDFDRFAWEACNGWIDQSNDCLTDKGFSVGRHELAPGLVIDVYNLHMDAGGSDGDHDAREAQTQQLLAEIAARSTGVAVLVAGDTNMSESSEYILVQLLEGAVVVWPKDSIEEGNTRWQRLDAEILECHRTLAPDLQLHQLHVLPRPAKGAVQVKAVMAKVRPMARAPR